MCCLGLIHKFVICQATGLILLLFILHTFKVLIRIQKPSWIVNHFLLLLGISVSIPSMWKMQKAWHFWKKWILHISIILCVYINRIKTSISQKSNIVLTDFFFLTCNLENYNTTHLPVLVSSGYHNHPADDPIFW